MLRPQGRNVRVSAVGGEHPHRLDVLRNRGTPEGRSPRELEPQSPALPGILPIPGVLGEAHVRVGASVQQGIQHLQMVRLLPLVRPRLRMGRIVGPPGLQHGKEG